tara:strand:+ start:4513 stop:4794 length:282 start_codon:yes stop_codon:yes gene_type:complete
MTVEELMERCNSQETGRILSYIKDGLEEINVEAETHVELKRVDIIKDKRFYEIPSEMTKMIDVRVKNHFNSKDEYRSVPRIISPPNITDADNI